MLTLKEQAEVCRIGLIIGLLSPQDAARWADGVIESNDNPNYTVIEVSLMSASTLPSIVSKLWSVQGSADSQKVLNTVLGLCHKALKAGKGFEMLNKLNFECGNNCHVKTEFVLSLPEDVSGRISELSYQMATASWHGNTQNVRQDALAYLSPFADYAKEILFERN